jgi:hypothetical protein
MPPITAAAVSIANAAIATGAANTATAAAPTPATAHPNTALILFRFCLNCSYSFFSSSFREASIVIVKQMVPSFTSSLRI